MHEILQSVVQGTLFLYLARSLHPSQRHLQHITGRPARESVFSRHFDAILTDLSATAGRPPKRLLKWVYRKPCRVSSANSSITCVPGVIKPLRVLWNEVIGFFFIVFGIWFGGAAVREYRHFNPTEGVGRLVITTLGAAIMLGYGIHSFLRARKIGRS